MKSIPNPGLHSQRGASMKEKRMIQTKEFCEMYGISRGAAYELFNNRRHKFPALKVGGRYYVDVSKVDEWFERYYGQHID